MTYCRQRHDLLDLSLNIPYERLVSRKQGCIQLKQWVPVEAFDETTGSVQTRAGYFDSIDLDFQTIGEDDA